MRGRWGQSVLCGALALGCGPAPVAAEGSKRALTLLHTADIHSRVWPFRSRISRFEAELGLGEALALAEVGGAARLATLLEVERRRGDALWLDSGDVLEGAEVFHRYGGHLELELLSSLGLGALALGNHELSLDGGTLGQLLEESAKFPVLAANLQPRTDSALWGRLVPSALLDVAGVKVGVVGVANPTSPPNLGSRSNPWGLERRELVDAVQVAVDELVSRAALIVVLSHLGLDEDRVLVASTSGIDLVLGGHQHILTAEPEWQDDCNSASLQETRGCSPRRVPIVHSGAYAQWLSRLELELAPDPAAPATFELTALSLTQLPVAASVPNDASVQAYLEAHRPPPEPPLAFLPMPLARRSALAGDSALGDLTADAVLAATSADVAVLNSSGLRDDLEAGPLLRSDLDLAFPFDEPWRLVWLDGRTLRDALERGAVRSAQRGCEAALQVAGLRLEIRCGACEARSPDCLQIERPGPDGDVPLADDARLLVALPVYLTLASGDFEDVGATGSDLAGTTVAFIAGYAASRGRRAADEPCASELGAWSPSRCLEAFGVQGCPLSKARARAACQSLPEVEGGRDGRITVLP